LKELGKAAQIRFSLPVAGLPTMRPVRTSAAQLTQLTFLDSEQGFPQVDDAFYAVVSLFGMLEVVPVNRRTGESCDRAITDIEGWILKQALCPEEDSRHELGAGFWCS
jgi:hypothetical protein